MENAACMQMMQRAGATAWLVDDRVTRRLRVPAMVGRDAQHMAVVESRRTGCRGDVMVARQTVDVSQDGEGRPGQPGGAGGL